MNFMKNVELAVKILNWIETMMTLNNTLNAFNHGLVQLVADGMQSNVKIGRFVDNAFISD